MTTSPLYEAHDAEWLALSALAQKADRTLESRIHHFLGACGFRRSNSRYGVEWYLNNVRNSLPQAFAIAEAKVADNPDEYAISYSGTLGSIHLSYCEAHTAAKGAHIAISAHEAAYTGWSRYWLVTSSNGLIHRSQHCSTCNKGRQSTEFALLPSLSGADFTSAVDALGPSLCSVCFPEAPVAVVDGPKLPSRITSLLFNQNGQSGFWAELAKYTAKRAAKVTG